MDFTIPAYHRRKGKENEKIDKYLALTRRLKNVMEHEGGSHTNCNYCVWNKPLKISKRTVGARYERTSQDQPYYSIVEVGPNTEKSPGYLIKLAVTETPVKDNDTTQPRTQEILRWIPTQQIVGKDQSLMNT